MLARQTKLVADLGAQLTTRVLPGVLQQGDKDANVFEVTVRDGSEAADLSGYSVTGYFQRGDSDRVPLTGSIEGNVVRVALQEACYAVSGSYAAFVRLVKAGTGEKITILRLGGYVESEGSGAILDPENRIPSVEDVIAKLDEMERVTEEGRAAATRATEAAERAEAAGEAAEEANEAAARANAAAEAVEGMTVEADAAPYGQGVNADIELRDGKYHISFQLETGPKGETGHGLDILGTYASLEALAQNVASPKQGDMYNVGTKPPYSIYMWQSSTSAWEYQGELQGATGPHFTPNVKVEDGKVLLSWTNNGGLDNPATVNIKGADGKTPEVGVDYFTPNDKVEIVRSVLEALPNANGVIFNGQ